MKSRLLLLSVLAFITALLAFRIKDVKTGISYQPDYSISKKIVSIGCSPNWAALKDWIEETDIPPIPGAGNYQWKISTASDSAQFYFNQGINTYYSFHIIESMASFKKAAKFDPNCAMLYWAQALAYGPNINDLGYAASPEALAAIKKAMSISANIPPKEKMLIDAQNIRYTSDSTIAREHLNQLYTDQMKVIYQKYNDEPDVAALYADALMLQHPWDLWENDGTPKSWTPSIRDVLEKLLATHPNHPGANHYYIHVMEASPHAANALPSADRLGKLTPGLSHTVHMPSHIYLRTGDFNKGVAVNEAALKSYENLIPIYSPITGNDFLYKIHNLHMQTNNAMLAGRSVDANNFGLQTMQSIPKDYLSAPGGLGNYIQYVYMTPTLVNIRFGNWTALLENEQPDAAMVFASVIYHFGRGMAYANTAQTSKANLELTIMQELMKDSVLKEPILPFSASIEGAIVAENLLKGTIALKENKFKDAITAFKHAVNTEENMVYNEPRDWMLNPKQYAADAYLKAGNIAAAKGMLLLDLNTNKENGWSLYGLWKVSIAEKKSAEAKVMLVRFSKAFAQADIKLSGPVF